MKINNRFYIYVALFISSIVYTFAFLAISEFSFQELGTFGDFIGGSLNPALSFLSFLILITTINLQIKSLDNSQQQLDLTRQELELTRQELAKSAAAQEESAKALKIQNNTSKISKFENTFFNLLNYHNNILHDLSQRINRNGTEMSGHIQRVAAKIKRKLSLKDARHYLLKEQDDTDHYLRLVYQILKFTDESYPEQRNDGNFHQEKKFYSNILRSVIDQDALEIIAVYAADEDENSSFAKFKKLIEKYEFLEHLKPQKELDAKIFEFLKEVYEPNAFGEN